MKICILDNLRVLTEPFSSNIYYVPPNYPLFLTYRASRLFPIVLKEQSQRVAQVFLVRCNGILRLERLAFFKGGSNHVDNVFEAIEKFAKELECKELECEVFMNINDTIYFPSTRSFVGTYNPMEYIDIYKSVDFRIKRVLYNCSVRPSDIHCRNDSIANRTMNTSDSRDMKTYYRLHGVNFDGDLIPWFDMYSYALGRGEYVIFAEEEKKVLGLVHWFPNFYPLLLKSPNGMFGSESQIREKLRSIKQGKIFKILIDPNCNKSASLITLFLVKSALNTMCSAFQIKEFQCGNFPLKTIQVVLKRFRGRVVHEIAVMLKKINIA